MAQHPGLPAPGKRSAKVYSKIHDHHNQAYVDAVACYLLSKFREADHSPHFSFFYGAYLAIAKITITISRRISQILDLIPGSGKIRRKVYLVLSH